MNVTPREAPIYGGGEILLELANQLEQEYDGYFVVFQGTQLRHVAVAVPSWNNGVLHLRATIPGHNQVESVELRAYAFHCDELKPLGVSGHFQYASDSAHQMAVFLLGSVEEPSHLDDLELVCRERFQLTPDVQANLDERLTAAFKALQLPPCWNMMGTRQTGGNNTERLLHFSARLGLIQLSRHFLTLPGSQASLSSPNHEGCLPEDLAYKSGFHELANLLKHCREQDIICHSTKTSLEPEKDNNSTLIVTTNINWSYRDLECDITELERRKKLFPRMNKNLVKLESMKDLHLIKNGTVESDSSGGMQGEDSHIAIDAQCSSSSLPRPSSIPRSHSPRCQARVLEDNLRRLRDIHEGIQKLRELNTKQIVVQLIIGCRKRGLTFKLPKFSSN